MRGPSVARSAGSLGSVKIRRAATRAAATALVLVVGWLAGAAVVYSPEYVWRVLTRGESDQGDYLEFFPQRPMVASTTPFMFENAPEGERVARALEAAFGVADVHAMLAGAGTQAFIVIQDDRVLYERYFNGAGRDTMLTSFSVAKSFDSILVGIAIDEGFIGDVHDPVTDYLPELLERDPGFAKITLHHLLSMASGLDYQELRWALFNGDDPITTYFPDQRDAALRFTTIDEPPGGHFSYNKYHPQLLGMVLERATGMTVTEYTQTRLWEPLGMEYDGAWALDDTGGFEKMEAGLNARAIDYAKLGRLMLRQGDWDGTRVVSADWIGASTALDQSSHSAGYYERSFGPAVYRDGSGYYGYFWYGYLRDDAPADVAAEGDHGQFIYISPSRDLIIVRIGTEYGLAWEEWIDGFYDVAGRL